MIAAMPGCILRVSGVGFPVDAFLAGSSIVACQVWHLGDPSLGSRQPTTTSGFNAVISDADDDLPAQVSGAIAFLRQHRGDLHRLSSMAAVDELLLDFGIPQLNVAGQFERFPSALVRAAAEFRMSFELSLYAMHS